MSKQTIYKQRNPQEARDIKTSKHDNPIHQYLTPFYATKAMFRAYLNYTKPLSYDEWIHVSEDDKAAVLYVQFFDQIVLAWYKVKSFYTPDEDGVSTMLQYLIKNVPVIKENPSRFSPAYIYRVAVNCLYCICHDIKRDRDRYDNEVSNLCVTGQGDVVDLFDTVPDTDGIASALDRDAFWAAVMSLDLSDEMYEFVLSLADMQCPKRLNDEKRAIIAQLKEVLAPFMEIYYK